MAEDGADRKVRKLPTLYFGRAPYFAHRNADALRPALTRLWRAICESHSKPVYWIQPCEVGGVKGGYVGDMFNRSQRRRQLAKIGASFSEDPFPRLREPFEFITDDWGVFTPSFMVVPYSADDLAAIPSLEGARLIAFLVGFSMRGATPQELSWAARGARHIVVVPGLNADEAWEAIEALAQ